MCIHSPYVCQLLNYVVEMLDENTCNSQEVLFEAPVAPLNKLLTGPSSMLAGGSTDQVNMEPLQGSAVH